MQIIPAFLCYQFYANCQYWQLLGMQIVGCNLNFAWVDCNVNNLLFVFGFSDGRNWQLGLQK